MKKQRKKNSKQKKSKKKSQFFCPSFGLLCPNFDFKVQILVVTFKKINFFKVLEGKKEADRHTSITYLSKRLLDTVPFP